MSRLITCPYNPCHQIRQERIQYHLIKCEKHHPHHDLVICPYNATHHIPRSDEHEHIKVCPDRRIIELQRYRFNEPIPGQHGMLANPPVYGSSAIPIQSLDQEPAAQPAVHPGPFQLDPLSQQHESKEDREVAELTRGGASSWSDTLAPSGTYLRTSSPGSTTAIFPRGKDNARTDGRTSPYPAKRHNSPNPLKNKETTITGTRRTSPSPSVRRSTANSPSQTMSHSPHSSVKRDSPKLPQGPSNLFPRTSSVKPDDGSQVDLALDISLSDIVQVGGKSAVQWTEQGSDATSMASTGIVGLGRGRGRGRFLSEHAKMRRPGQKVAESDTASIATVNSTSRLTSPFEEKDFADFEI